MGGLTRNRALAFAAGLLAGLWPASSVAAPTAVTGTGAAFTDSIGVAIHEFYPDTAYWDKPRLKQLLQELGVKHVRDGIVLNRHVYEDDRGVKGYEYVSARDLAASGIKFQWIVGEPDAAPNAPTRPSEAIAALTDPARLAGTAEALEGPNEYDRLRRPGVGDRDPVWASKLYDFMAEFHTAMNNDSRFAAMPFYGPSFLSSGGRAEYASMPGAAQFMDAPNAHIYGGGRPPEPTVQSEANASASLFGNRRPVISETGYHTAINNGNFGHFGVSERAQSIYLARNVLLGFAAGAPRTYVYQFLDQKPEPALRNMEEHFGLVAVEGDATQSERTWTTRKKPAFDTLRRILDITRDTGTDARPTALDYSLSGAAAGGLRRMLLARSGGVVDLVLWNPVSVYKEPIWDCNHPDIPPDITDPHQRCEWAKYNRAVDQGDLFPADVPVTLDLGERADVSTQRPHSEAGFTARGRGTSFALQVGPDPIFVRIKLSKYATEVRNDQPSAWLRLNEASGAPVDSAGRGATVGPWSAAPSYGQGSAVGDVDDRSVGVGPGQRVDVQLPAPVSTGSGTSLELWVKPDLAVPDFVDFLTADTPDPWRVKMRTYNQHDGFRWGSTYGSGFGQEMVFKGFDNGSWHHLVLTMASGTSTTYLDGTKVGERTGGDSLDLRRFTLGAHPGASAFAGAVDELAVYGSALSAARVCAHYRAAGGSC